MPTLCMVLNAYFSPAHRTFLMPPKSLDDSDAQNPTNDLKTVHNEDQQASILVFISAHAIGSVGLAMSILAIWLGWLLPASIASTTPEPPEIRQSRSPPRRHHRRPSHLAPISVPPPTPPMRRASAPVNLTPILSSRPGDPSGSTPRHVYFEDSSSTAIARRNTLPTQSSSMILDDGPAPAPFTASPLALSVELPTQESTDIIPGDSDSSPHSSKASLVKHSRLHKLKLFGNGRATPRLDLDKPGGDQASIASTDTNNSEKSARRASGSFVASWSLSRTRTAPEVTSTESHATSPSRHCFARRLSPVRPPTSPASITPTTPHTHTHDIRSPTFLTRKRQNRVSAPIPRTSPYGAPYFAAPPLLLDTNYPAYLKTLPQFEDEVHAASAHVSDSDLPEHGRGRTASIRRVNLTNAPVPKQRSASIDFTTRPNATS